MDVLEVGASRRPPHRPSKFSWRLRRQLLSKIADPPDRLGKGGLNSKGGDLKDACNFGGSHFLQIWQLKNRFCQVCNEQCCLVVQNQQNTDLQVKTVFRKTKTLHTKHILCHTRQFSPTPAPHTQLYRVLGAICRLLIISKQDYLNVSCNISATTRPILYFDGVFEPPDP